MHNRVCFNKATGEIFYQLFSETPHENIEVGFLDIESGEINYNTHYIESIDPDGHPVIKMKELTPIELENAKLKEDIILLQADAEAGGIL